MKISPWTIFTIALSVCAIILTVGICQFWLPKTTEAQNYLALRDKLQMEGNKLAAQQRKLTEAYELREAAAEQWRGVVARKTPPASVEQGGIDLSVNRWYLVNDVVRFRNRIQLDLNNQLRRGGVKVISGPTVPAFPDNPLTVVEEGFNFPRLGFPARVYDFGAVTVEGSMEQIRRHVEAWSNMPKYLAVTDGLRIDGTPPRLRATYNLSMVMYIRTSGIHPPVPEVPGAEAPGGGGGGAPAGPIGGGAPPAGGGGGGPVVGTEGREGAGR